MLGATPSLPSWQIRGVTLASRHLAALLFSPITCRMAWATSRTHASPHSQAEEKPCLPPPSALCVPHSSPCPSPQPLSLTPAPVPHPSPRESKILKVKHFPHLCEHVGGVGTVAPDSSKGCRS